MVSTFRALLPFVGHASGTNAAKIKYASIDLTLAGHGGLLVLAEQQPGVTYWQTGNNETVVFDRGYLSSTSGLSNNLQMTKLSGDDTSADSATPFPGNLDIARHYQVIRRWGFGKNGKSHTMLAEATFSCDPGLETVKLPLAKLPLRECHEILHWQPSGTSESTYWIDPKDNRIWKARTTPWPHGPVFAWEVARPWW